MAEVPSRASGSRRTAASNEPSHRARSPSGPGQAEFRHDPAASRFGATQEMAAAYVAARPQR